MIKRIIEETRKLKMAMRKEWHREQNRNYHMDPNKPTEILEYLNWNKDIHMKGIIKNAIAIPCLAVAAGFGLWPTVVLPFLALELGSLFINFQCVNIQNCNIYRYKEKEEAMKRPLSLSITFISCTTNTSSKVTEATALSLLSSLLIKRIRMSVIFNIVYLSFKY